MSKANELLDLIEGKADADAVRDLQLSVENDGDMYRSMLLPIQKNLMKKFKADKFDLKLAAKAYQRVADAGAKKFQKDSDKKFDKAVRDEVAKLMAAEFEDNAKSGEFDDD